MPGELPILRAVLGEEKIVLFERVVVPVDIDNVPEMEKGEELVSFVGDGSFRIVFCNRFVSKEVATI